MHVDRARIVLQTARFGARWVIVPQPRLLLADGDALYRRAACRLLKAEFLVTPVVSGDSAIAEVQRTPTFDVILLDFALRDRQAIEVHRHLAVEHPTQARRVLFLTWRLSDEVALALGGPILRKPFSLSELWCAFDALPAIPTP
jgi:CheY-like chemotaxis protein